MSALLSVQLKTFIQQQLLIIRSIEEVDLKAIRWQGHLYDRQEVATHELRRYGVHLWVGGGVYLIGE